VPSDRIVIVGGVACGPKAASRARRRNPGVEIVIVERGPYLSYAGCGLPYFIGGSVGEIKDLWTTQYAVERNVAFFKDTKDVNVLLRTEATGIDRKNKIVHLKNLETGEASRIEYGKLVLATGGSPNRPPIEGLHLERVFCLHSPSDALAIRDLIEKDEVDCAAIIGGGSIGLEAVESFFAHAVDAVILEREDQILPGLVDADLAAYVAGELLGLGVACYTSETVLRVEGDEKGKAAKVVTNRREVAGDMVLLAAGVRPNVELARDAGLEIGPTGALAVDDRLRTSDPSIFAGGDCVECTHLVSRKKVFAPLGSTANKHGRMIGDNLTGGDETFSGILGTAILKSLKLNVARTGLTTKQAREAGFDTLETLTPSLDKAHYSPGGKPFLLKLVVDRKSERVLGAQAAGPGDLAKRIDVLATHITCGGTLKELSDLDLAYAPPFSTAVDPVAHAANHTRNRLNGLVQSVTAGELLNRLRSDDNFILLDVRQPKEVEKNKIEDRRLKHVSLLDLRREMAKAPKDVEIVCVCQTGPRSYEACMTLKGMGLGKVSFLEGGMRVWPFLGTE